MHTSTIMEQQKYSERRDTALLWLLLGSSVYDRVSDRPGYGSKHYALLWRQRDNSAVQRGNVERLYKNYLVVVVMVVVVVVVVVVVSIVVVERVYRRAAGTTARRLPGHCLRLQHVWWRHDQRQLHDWRSDHQPALHCIRCTDGLSACLSASRLRTLFLKNRTPANFLVT